MKSPVLGIDTTSLVLQGVCEQSLQLLFKNGKKLKRNDIEYDGMERFFFGFRFIGNDDEIVAQVGEIRTYAWVSFDDLKDYLLFDNQLQDTTEKLLELFPSLQR